MVQLRYRPPIADRPRNKVAIPESHTLYVCPQGCARRHALHALAAGWDQACSFYLLGEGDVVAGSVDHRMPAIVEELFKQMDVRPRVLMIVFTCVTDVMGTDSDAVQAVLAEAFPDTRFIISHINPINDQGFSGKFGMQGNVYDLLEPSLVRDDAINVVGRFNALPAQSEFADVMGAWGVSALRSAAACVTYDEYCALASSALSLSVSWMGNAPARQMEQRLGIPWLAWEPGFGEEALAANYERLHAALQQAGIAPLEASPWDSDVLCAPRDRMRAAWGHAREVLGDTPVAIDSLATFAPISLAEEMLVAGFNVVAVLCLHVKGGQGKLAKSFSQRHPQVELLMGANDIASCAAADLSGLVSIGNDAATLLGAPCGVDLFHDEGCFGFDGSRLLMEALVWAVQKGTRVRIDAEGSMRALDGEEGAR